MDRQGPDAFDQPDRPWQGSPADDHADQDRTRDGDEDRPLEGAPHDPGPPSLEGRARHDGVLHREQGQEAEVDGQRRADRTGDPIVEGLRHDRPADESDQVQKRREEDGVDGEADHRGQSARAGFGARLWLGRVGRRDMSMLLMAGSRTDWSSALDI